jgi:hypothetical protein
VCSRSVNRRPGRSSSLEDPDDEISQGSSNALISAKVDFRNRYAERTTGIESSGTIRPEKSLKGVGTQMEQPSDGKYYTNWGPADRQVFCDSSVLSTWRHMDVRRRYRVFPA